MAATLPARANFPEKPIKVIVPFAPGGGVDIMARLLADFMSRDLGQSVIVENKPGAGTIVGTEEAARSAPDGYTLLMASSPFAINPSIHVRLPYDTFKAFAPVALVARSFDIVVVSSKLPFKSIQDVIAYAKANPNKLNFGSPGIGTSVHLAGEMFKSMAQVEMTHIPYKGSAPALTDLLRGNSGGPLISEAGSLIGVNSFKKPDAEGLNFSVSVDEVKRFLARSGNRPERKNEPAGTTPVCALKEISRFRNKKNDATIIAYDTKCTGRANANYTIPDAKTESITYAIDRNDDGRPDVIYFDLKQQKKWDVSFWDEKFEGHWTLVGYHPDGKMTPSSFESYDKFQSRVAAR
jgi:hypothetical protein